MVGHSIYQNTLTELSLHFQALTAAADGDAIIDLQGYEGPHLIIIAAGTITDGTSYEFDITHGDANDLSDGVEVPDADLNGSEPTFLAANDDTVAVLEYKGRKRYLRVDLKTVVGSPSTGGVFGAMVVKRIPRHAPTV